jgi:hydrogenase maturation protein HypF
MRLEAIAASGIEFGYPFDLLDVVSFESTIRAIVDDIMDGIHVAEISAKFHNTVINVIFAIASQIRKETGLDKVVLSGGTFQNKYLLSRIEKILEKEKFEVYSQLQIPSNDGGIALGQLIIAAKRRELGLVN